MGDVLGAYYHSHRRLENLFYEAGAVGKAPEASCRDKCILWLRRMHADAPDPAAVLGKVLEPFMEVDDIGRNVDQADGRKRIEAMLARHGLSYHQGGLILGAGRGLPTKSLAQVLRDRDLAQVDKEFERSLANIEADPAATVTAASSILESLFKVYIEDNGLEMPADESLKPLYRVASRHLGLDPGAVADEDIRKVLSGMNSVVDGIGSLRTHAGSAHGRGRRAYALQGRHARLAIHASHTLVGFFLETWDEHKRRLGRTREASA